MTVKELIELLQTYPSDYKVLRTTTDYPPHDLDEDIIEVDDKDKAIYII